nr:MAG: late control gene D protein [Bacteriophage sp.]
MKILDTAITEIVKGNSARYYSKYIVDGKEYTNTLNKFNFQNITNPNNEITIGNTCASSVTFSIYMPQVSLENKEITIYEGVKVSNEIKYIKLGTFTVSKQTSNGEYTSYEAYDKMYKADMPYSSDLVFPSTDKAILTEICGKLGISLATNIVTAHTVSDKPQGYTMREIIGYMAMLQGCNAVINADGNLELRWYKDSGYVLDGHKYYQQGVTFTTSKDFIIQKLTCNNTKSGDKETSTITSGSGATGLSFANPFMTQAVLDEVYKKIGGFQLRPLTVKFVGDWRLEPGDIITVNKSGVDYKVPIMQITHECDGGLMDTVTSIGQSDTENSNIASGPITKQMERYYANLLVVNKALINKLDVDTAKITYATIANLNATNANIDALKTNKLDAAYADIINANVESLKAANAEITQLKANSLTVDIADLKYAQIDFANVKGQVVGTSLIKDGAVTNEKVQSLSANKLTAGVIDAAKITVNNLNADNITAGTINGKRIGTGSLSLDKLSEEVPTKEYLDKVQEELQGQIDGNIETFTKTEIPTLNNEPAVNWTDNATRKKHIGDICYVVNPASSADGYSYRFANTGTEQTPVYEWVLIKDSDVTKALQDIININGEITGIKKFDVEISSWKTDTDSELSSLKTRTTSLETDMGNKVDTTTFNKVKQTVDENSSTITKMSETLSKKADSGTVTTLSNTVNSIKQTTDSNTSSISSLTTTVTKVESTANSASKTASEAKTAASKAETAASNSATNASNAASKANAAATSASNAEKSASNSASSASIAATSAANAKKSADTANTNASAAVSTANTAKSTADSAKSTATAANNTANTAKSTADSALSKVNTLTTTVTNQGSSITQLQGSITNKVWKQDITTAVNDIQIGGTNLIRNSNFFQKDAYWTYDTGTGTIISDNSVIGNVLVFKPTGGLLRVFANTRNVWVANEIYTVSFYAKASVANTTITPSRSVADSASAVTLTTTWKRYTGTIRSTATSDSGSLSFSVNNINATYYIAAVKLEKGNKATDWSPAPEDVDEKFTNYSTTTQMNNAITQAVTAESNSIKLEVSNTYATKDSLNNYSTTTQMNAAISTAISKESSAIKLEVAGAYATKDSLKNYATTASLSAYIKKDPKSGELKSAIEAIADTINITARGGLNLSGNRFTLNSTNTSITADGTITCKNFVGNGGTIGGWNINSTSIYSDYRYDPSVGYGLYRVSLDKSTGSDSKVMSVRATVKDNVFNYPFYVRSDGYLYTVKGQISGFQFDSNKMSNTVSIYLLPDKDVLHTLRNAIVNNTTSQLALSQYDLNGSGKVDLTDFVVAKNYVLGTQTETDFSKWKYAKKSDITYKLNPSDVKNALSISGTDIWGKTRQTTLGIGTLYSNEISCDNLIVKDPVDYSTFNTFLNTINVKETSTSIDLENFVRNYAIKGNGMLVVNISIWTDTKDDYGTTTAKIYIDGNCVMNNRNRLANSHPSELAGGATFVWWFNDNATHRIKLEAGSTKEGTKTYTQSIQALFGLQIST